LRRFQQLLARPAPPFGQGALLGHGRAVHGAVLRGPDAPSQGIHEIGAPHPQKTSARAVAKKARSPWSPTPELISCWRAYASRAHNEALGVSQKVVARLA